VLGGKGKIWIFKKEIGENDQFSHKSSEGNFGGFTAGAEVLIKSFQNRVVTGGGNGGHVESQPDVMAPAGDVSLASKLATIAIEGSQASQGSGLGWRKRSQFGHEDDEGGRSERADALDLLKAVGLAGQDLGVFEFGGDEGFEGLKLFLEEENGFADQGDKGFIAGSFQEIPVLHDQPDELLAMLEEWGQFLLGRGRPEGEAEAEKYRHIRREPRHRFYQSWPSDPELWQNPGPGVR